ncbi:MAG: hypothetical protein LUG12_01260 [Erysipelotrichaceae bacterium]|nr:hypothetical protein [Erysipelotrichaceae bacterium]
MGKFCKILIALSMIFILCSCSNNTDENDNEEVAQIQEETVEEDVIKSITLTFVGDITLGNYVG